MAKKKHIYNKSTGRSYVYDQKYESSPSQIKNREERNLARNQAMEYLTSKYGKEKAQQMMKGMDVDHIKALAAGGSNKKSNRRLRSVHSNRGDKKF